MKLELNVLVPVSTLWPPVAPNSELACSPSSVSLNLLLPSALRLRYQLQPNNPAKRATMPASPSCVVVFPSRLSMKLGSSAGGGGGGAAFLTGAGGGAAATGASAFGDSPFMGSGAGAGVAGGGVGAGAVATGAGVGAGAAAAGGGGGSAAGAAFACSACFCAWAPALLCTSSAFWIASLVFLSCAARSCSSFSARCFAAASSAFAAAAAAAEAFSSALAIFNWSPPGLAVALRSSTLVVT